MIQKTNDYIRCFVSVRIVILCLWNQFNFLSAFKIYIQLLNTHQTFKFIVNIIIIICRTDRAVIVWLAPVVYTVTSALCIPYEYILFGFVHIVAVRSRATRKHTCRTVHQTNHILKVIQYKGLNRLKTPPVLLQTHDSIATIYTYALHKWVVRVVLYTFDPAPSLYVSQTILHCE